MTRPTITASKRELLSRLIACETELSYLHARCTGNDNATWDSCWRLKSKELESQYLKHPKRKKK